MQSTQTVPTPEEVKEQKNAEVLLKEARKKMTKSFIKKEKLKLKNKQYYSEDNALNAIEAMDKSVLGRTGHRNLCKRLGLSWKDYKIALDIVRNPDPEEK